MERSAIVGKLQEEFGNRVIISGSVLRRVDLTYGKYGYKIIDRKAAVLPGMPIRKEYQFSGI